MHLHIEEYGKKYYYNALPQIKRGFLQRLYVSYISAT